MKALSNVRFITIAGAVVLIMIALWLIISASSSNGPEWITTTITRGSVTEIIAISGVVEAENNAELAFPVTGVVTNVAVAEGDIVKAGDTLATLEQTRLIASRNEALAALTIARADRTELINGPTASARAVTDATIVEADTALDRAIIDGNEAVENARRTLRSAGLEAIPERKEGAPQAPIISGTYTCDAEGTYTISPFRSGADSGYSYTTSGLETLSAQTAFTDAPASFGNCGLSIQFIDGESYNRRDHTITIPNTRSSSYTTNLATYQNAITARDSAIASAENALLLAEKTATETNAAPRSESLTRASAAILQAEARLTAAEADIADRTITAPFSGVITNVDILAGETASNEPVITLLADTAFEITARVPEIDITKIAPDQRTEILFDAASDQVLTGSVGFISPVATEIDGVAYYETKIILENPPTWIRSGLNADINIITTEKENVLRIPKRFLSGDNDQYTITIPDGRETRSENVDVVFIGNDGFVEITGRTEDELIIAP